jgi:ABC-type lipoprotein release transport system permease subunit
MLFEVSTSDPLGIAATIALMVFGGLVASFFPARRATRVNPVQALRYE